MFFTQFLLTFATRTQIDQSGNPISNQAKRLKYLKWPIIMVLFLLLGPVVLVIIDTFMGILIGVFENPNSGGAFNYQHVVSTSVIHQRMSEIKTLSTTVLLNDLQSVRTYLNQLDNYYSLLQETIFSAKNVDQIDLNILKSTIGNDDLYKILTTNSMGILPRYISSAIAAINKVEEYIRVDMQDDINRFQQIIPNIRINEYISSSDATKLTAIRSNLIQLFNESQKIGTNIANLTKTSPSVQSG
jgi:hypothetical protein